MEQQPPFPRIINFEETTDLCLQFEKRNGLLPVIIQEATSRQVLMLAYTNKLAFEMTVEKGIACFWSTSRENIWIKGETSGNTLRIEAILVDCDQDALIYQVSLNRDGVCHTISLSGKNRKACFYRAYSSKNELKFINNMK